VLFNDFINIIIGGKCNFSSSMILLEGDQSINVSPKACCFNNLLCDYIHFIAIFIGNRNVFDDR